MRVVATLCAFAAACTLALDPDRLEFAATATDAPSDTVAAADDEGAPPPDEGALDPGAPPGDPGPEVSPKEPNVAAPGGGTCQLAYDPCDPPISLGCPTTCPAKGWELTFDAQGFTGAKTYAWTFGPVDGYSIDVDSSSSKRPTVTLQVTGSLIGKAALDKFNLPLTLKVDGQLQATIPVEVTPFSSSGCTEAPGCAAPPAE